jgi:multicomponent Na+:H+ antiporter subunit C
MMEVAVIMFFLGIGFSPDALPPIGENLQNFENVADPLPQALMITAIVIGLSVSAVNIVMVITLFRRFKTTDWNTVKKLSKGESK